MRMQVLRRSIAAFGVAATLTVIGAPAALAQTSATCPPPGPPPNRPPGQANPGQPDGRPPAYPPGQCRQELDNRPSQGQPQQPSNLGAGVGAGGGERGGETTRLIGGDAVSRPPAAAAEALRRTGAEAGTLAAVGVSLVGGGALLVLGVRRRREVVIA